MMQGRRGMRQANAFKGSEANMNGHVFQCANEMIDKNQFNKMLEALAQYIAKNVKYPGDMVPLTKEIVKPTIASPGELDLNEKSGLVKALWDRQVDGYFTRTGHIESNLKAMYAIIWGQCSEAMQAKLKSLSDFEVKDGENDCVWLLTAIWTIIVRFKEKSYVQLALTDAWIMYYTYRQGPDMTVATYIEEFCTLVDVLEHHGGSISIDAGCLKAEDASLSDTQKVKSLHDKALAIQFLRQATRRRFGALWEDLANQFSRGNNQYPKDLAEAHALLVSFKQSREFVPRRGRQPDGGGTPIVEGSGLSFTQLGAMAGTDGILHEHITCFGCQAKGHYSNACPRHGSNGEHDGASRVQLMQFIPPTALGEKMANSGAAGMVTDADADAVDYGFTFTLLDGRYDLIPSSWVLLDSQSTVSVFRNKRLLSQIRESMQHMKVFTNGGTQTSSMVGEVRNFGTVWYNPQSLANILSLAEVRKKFCVTMDTDIEPALCVHRADGTIMKFQEYTTGLYYFDASQTCNNVSDDVIAYSFIATVASNKLHYHRREIEAADKARALYRKIGRPSTAQFEHILLHGLIRNCPITVDDARRAVIIYGPDVPGIKGKTTRGKGKMVPTFDPVPIPLPILDLHRKATLCADIFLCRGCLSFIPSHASLSSGHFWSWRTKSVREYRKE